MAMDLRPLSLGELLDRSFSLYRRHFWTFVAIMALPSVFAMCVGVTMQLMQETMARATLQGSEPDFQQIGWMLAIGGGAMLLMFLGYWIAYMVALGATTQALSEVYLGRAVTAAAAYAAVRRRTGGLILLLLLIWVRIIGIALLVAGLGGGLLAVVAVSTGAAAVVGGLLVVGMMLAAGLFTAFLMLRYSLAVPALVLEGLTGRGAIARSVDLSRGNLGRIVVLVIFATIVVYATALIFQGPFMVAAVMAGAETRAAFWLNLAGAVTGAVAGAISGPLMMIALALLYYDARVRQEGLDLHIMMDALGTPQGPPQPPAPSRSVVPG